MDWAELTISTTSEGADVMSQILIDEGAAGTAIEDARDLEQFKGRHDEWDYVDESVFFDRGGVVLVKGYFPASEDTDKLIKRISEKAHKTAAQTAGGFNYGSGKVTVSSVKDEDWAENWKRYYKPMEIGARLAVRPVWEEYDSPLRKVIVLEPGSAFGTGQHETTLMCLELCQLLCKKGDEVLDVGCGTGILGIAALALGAKSVTAVDRDVIAVDAAKSNAALNGCLDKITVVHGDLACGIEGGFDLIFANIVADAVIALLPQTLGMLKEGGSIVASGIIKGREQDVLQNAQRVGLLKTARLEMGEWIALRFQR